MKKLSLLLACFLLTGCIKYVYIPVYSCPEPKIPEKKELKTKDSGLKDTDAILKAMVYDILYLDSYSEQLKVILEGYKSK